MFWQGLLLLLLPANSTQHPPQQQQQPRLAGEVGPDEAHVGVSLSDSLIALKVMMKLDDEASTGLKPPPLTAGGALLPRLANSSAGVRKFLVWDDAGFDGSAANASFYTAEIARLARQYDFIWGARPRHV